MNNYLFILVFFILPINLLSQSNSEYRKLAEQKIAKDAITIIELGLENDRLQKKIEAIRNDTKSSDKELKNALNHLFSNNLLIREKELELKILRESFLQLESENDSLKTQVEKMESTLEKIVRENIKKERKLTKKLKKEGRHLVLRAAKQEAVKKVLFKPVPQPQKDVFYYILREKGGEQIEPTTNFSFYCGSTSGHVKFTVHFPDKVKSQKVVLIEEGDHKVITYNNLKYKIILINKIWARSAKIRIQRMI